MISVVIPTFRRTETLARLLEDLRRQEGAEFEIIVVDDCSPSDPIPELQRVYPEVRYLRNERNSGPAVTRNRGIRAARGEIVVGFDNDVSVPDPHTLRRVGSLFSEKADLTGLAFRILRPDGVSDDAERWWHPVRLRDFACRPFLTSYFSGTAYAFRREAMIGAGLFPEILFMHYEEVELALRIVDQGGRIMYCPHIFVHHHAHPVSRRSEIREFYKPRNQVLVAASCLPVPRALAYVLPRLGYQFAVALRGGHVGSFFRAMRSAAVQLPACLDSRMVLKHATFRRLAELRHGVAI